MKKSIVADMDEVERFATEAMEVLRKQPQTVEEIGESNQRHTEFKEKMPDMEMLMERSDRKNKVLALWTKEQVETFLNSCLVFFSIKFVNSR